LGNRTSVAQNTSGGRSAIDGRTTRHPGYAVSQRIRKRVEEAFGLGQDGGRLAQDAASRAAKGRLAIHPRLAAYDLVRLPKLLAQDVPCVGIPTIPRTAASPPRNSTTAKLACNRDDDLRGTQVR